MASQRVWDGAGCGFAEQRLELGEGLLDRVEVGTVGRQAAQRGASRFDGVPHAGALVSRKVVHHDDVAGRQCRHENLLDIGQEGWAVHGAVEHHGGCHAGEPQAGREGGRLPMSMRDGRPAAFAAPRPATQSGHLGRGPRLVDEDQLLGIKLELIIEPGLTRVPDVLALLLGRMSGFF